MSAAASGARPELAAYAESLRLDPAALVTRLRDLLGARLVAYLAEVTQTRTVGQWADGTGGVPPEAVLARLRVAYQAARLVADRAGAGTAQAWFTGLNPVLADRSPARLLREGDLDEVGPRVLAAARQSAATG